MRLGRERRSARQRRAEQLRRRRIIILIAVLVVVPMLTLAILAVIASMGLRTVAAVEGDLPSLEDQRQVSLAETSQIYASDGTLLAYLHGVENRTVISGKQIPDSLKHAIVAVEDERFYQHTGRGRGGLRPRARDQHPIQIDRRGLFHHHHAVGRQPVPRSHRRVAHTQVG